jgi:hypothetical protein
VPLTPTATGTPQPPYPQATIAPNPARSGQRVTLNGRPSYGSSPLHWSQAGGDVALQIEDPDSSAASFVAPDVAEVTVVQLRLEIASAFPSSVTYDVTIVPMDTILVTLGSATGPPGGSALVDITLQPLGLSVASLQNELGFSAAAAVADRGDGTPDCAPAAELSIDSASFTFLPSGCIPGQTCSGVRATVEGLGPIADRAVVYRCRVAFTTELADSCEHALTCAGGTAAAADGGALRLSCSDGILTAFYNGPPLSFDFHAEPPEPAIGDMVRVTFSVTGGGGIPYYSLSGAAPFLSGETMQHSNMLGDATFMLHADCPGTARLQLSVNYETTGGCPGFPIFYFRFETSPAFALPIPDPNGYRVSGRVAEFPDGCEGATPGLTVVLEPLGWTAQTALGGGDFAFEGVPPGDYTLRVPTGCNPFGCWPQQAIHVGNEDVSVALCPVRQTVACPGDCDGNRTVAIDELVIAVGKSLGEVPLTDCPSVDANGDGDVRIDELIDAVVAALHGCP